MTILSDFVYDEFHAKMEEPLIDQYLAEQDAMLKPVTVRLPPEVVQTLDNLAGYFNVSRQELNTKIIESGITDILTTLAKASLHYRKKLPDNIEETDEWPQMLEEERLKFIKELLA